MPEQESGQAPVSSRPTLSRTLVLVGATSFLTDLSSEMVYPLLPVLVVGTLGASATVLGVIEGLAESIPALTKVYSGRLSDRAGRRKHLAVAGYSLSTIGKVCLAAASGPAAVLAGRVMDRFGKGIRVAPRDALIADVTHKDHRGHAYGFHRMMDTAGAALGVLGAYLILVSANAPGSQGLSPVRLALWLSLVPAVLAVVVLSLVREKPAHRPSAPRVTASPWKGWGVLSPRLRTFLVISFVFALAASSNQFLLLRAQQILSSHGHGAIESAGLVCLLYLLYNLTYAAASYPLGRLSDTLGRKPVLVCGYLLYAVIYACFAVNDSPLACWLLFGAYGFFPALTEGVEKALVSDLAPRESRATLLGLHGTVQGIGLFPASVIGGVLWDRVSPGATFWFAAAMGFAAAVGLAFLPGGRNADQLPDGRIG